MKRTPLSRNTPLRKRNAKRLKRLRDAQFGDKARWVRERCSCLICTKTPVDPAHVKSRGSGGRSSDIIPLCREHHNEQHQMGILSFERKYGIPLILLAKAFEAMYQSRFCWNCGTECGPEQFREDGSAACDECK